MSTTRFRISLVLMFFAGCTCMQYTEIPCHDDSQCPAGYICGTSDLCEIGQRPDEGSPDAGPVDAGLVDAGPIDAGPIDGGIGLVPGAPTGVIGVAGNASAVISWTAPSDGGSPITGYTVTPSAGSPVTTTGTSATITGLTNGTLYTFTVHATNANGDGPESAPVTVEPRPSAVSGLTLRVGYESACVIDSAGALSCWGDTGPLLEVGTPEKIGSDAWLDVGIGADFKCGLHADSTLWCWGSDPDGELGDGASTTVTRTTPQQLGTSTWTTVAGGPAVACGIQTNGSLWCWGTNYGGQFGNGTTSASPSPPVQVGAATDWASLSLGSGSVCAVKTNGTLWCWGGNHFGQLGLGTRTDFETTPRQVGSSTSWAEVACGDIHTCGLQKDGTLWCWGDNTFGQLGTGENTSYPSPHQVGSSMSWSHVSAGVGANFACGLQTDHTLWCWGSNAAGQLGNGTYSLSPGPLFQVPGNDWTAVGAGDQSACGSKSDGTVWCWGSNASGQIGVGLATKYVPTRIGAQLSWNSVSVGNNAACATDINAGLSCWGTNTLGQLGTGDTNPGYQVPTSISSGTTWTHISTGVMETCGIKSDGTLWCWGVEYAAYPAYTDSPTQVGTATWIDVDVGSASICAIQTDGSLWCWGSDDSGLLADGKTLPETAPVRASGSITWSRVSVGVVHACGVSTAGALYCWGGGADGVLGTGAAMAETPAQVGTSTNWVDVSCGNEMTCGLQADGSLWCWGNDIYAESGPGYTRGVNPTPVEFPGGGSWSHVDLGQMYGCAIRSDGTLWCWGTEAGGLLGQGVPTMTTSPPVQVGSDTDWASISAGYGDTCGVKTDNSLWCWGGNVDGEVGDGTAFYPNPMQVTLP